MVATPEPGRIDQIIYQDTGRRHLLDHFGVGPVATSLDPGDLASWDTVLRHRLPNDSAYDCPSLCYLGEDDKGRCALLYRTQRGEHRLSGFAHVLLGTSADLPAEAALGSWRWDWRGALTPENVGPMLDPARRGRFHPVSREDTDDLNRAARRELSSLNQAAGQDRAAQRALIGVLRRPNSAEEKFVIVAEPGEQRILILAGLQRWLSDRFLAGGFSTHELNYSEGQPGLPRVIFTNSRERHSSYQMRRVRVDLTREIAASSEDVARAANILLSQRHQERVPPTDAHWIKDFLEHMDRDIGLPGSPAPPPLIQPGPQPEPPGALPEPASDRQLAALIAYALGIRTEPLDVRNRLRMWAAHQGTADNPTAFRENLRKQKICLELPPQAAGDQPYELADAAVDQLTVIAYPGPDPDASWPPQDAAQRGGALSQQRTEMVTPPLKLRGSEPPHPTTVPAQGQVAPRPGSQEAGPARPADERLDDLFWKRAIAVPGLLLTAVLFLLLITVLLKIGST